MTPTIDQPLRTGASAPEDAAIVVGIADYFVLPDVPFADRDAAAVYDLLVYARGVAPSRVNRMTTANREQILAAVSSAAATVGPDGTLWVYFSGHGAASPSTGELLLVGVDAQQDPAAFESRAVPIADLRAAAGPVASRTIFVLDTCWAGKGRQGEELVPGARFAVPAYAVAPDTGPAVWTATTTDQIALSYDAVQHGAFTWFAVGALRGWADGELDGTPDGAVTFAEAEAYVGRALPTAQKRNQTPHLAASASWRERVLVSGSPLEADPLVAPDAAVAVPAGPASTDLSRVALAEGMVVIGDSRPDATVRWTATVPALSPAGEGCAWGFEARAWNVGHSAHPAIQAGGYRAELRVDGEVAAVLGDLVPNQDAPEHRMRVPLPAVRTGSTIEIETLSGTPGADLDDFTLTDMALNRRCGLVRKVPGKRVKIGPTYVHVGDDHWDRSALHPVVGNTMSMDIPELPPLPDGCTWTLGAWWAFGRHGCHDLVRVDGRIVLDLDEVTGGGQSAIVDAPLWGVDWTRDRAITVHAGQCAPGDFNDFLFDKAALTAWCPFVDGGRKGW